MPRGANGLGSARGARPADPEASQSERQEGDPPAAQRRDRLGRRRRPVALFSRLRGPVALSPADHRICCAAVRRIARDARRAESTDDGNVLMLYELCALLLRLELAGRRTSPAPIAGSAARHASELADLIERELGGRREVGWYARRLGVSARTLNRATERVAGRTVKELVDERIVLEAKRLLVHTTMAVDAVAERLGFDDPSNFVRFFRRLTGTTPSGLRRSEREGRHGRGDRPRNPLDGS